MPLASLLLESTIYPPVLNSTVSRRTRQDLVFRFPGGELQALDLSSRTLLVRMPTFSDLNSLPVDHLKSTAGERIFLYRSLSLLLGAGIPIVKALKVCQEATETSFAVVISELSEKIVRGHTVWDAMSTYPSAFRRSEVLSISAAGQTGGLVQVFGLLSDKLGDELKLRMELKKALTYPLFVLATCLVVVVVLPPYLFGSLFEFLKSSNVELPWASGLVYNFSSMVGSPMFWPALLLGGLILWSLSKSLWKNQGLASRVQRFLLSFSLTGDAYRSLLSVRFASVLSMTLHSGVALQKSFQLAAASLNNEFVESRLKESYQEILAGRPLSESLGNAGVFHSLLLTFVEVGSETGELDVMLVRAQSILEEELRAKIEALVSVLEPCVLVLMGLIVGFFVLATLLPLSKMLEAL